MNNEFKHLPETSANLFDCCRDYIDSANTAEGQKTANEKIYNLCADYLFSDKITRNKRQHLMEFFKIL